MNRIQPEDKNAAIQDAPADDWGWKTWADVPQEVQSQLTQGPFPKGLELDGDTKFYDALKKIVGAL